MLPLDAVMETMVEAVEEAIVEVEAVVETVVMTVEGLIKVKKIILKSVSTCTVPNNSINFSMEPVLDRVDGIVM